MPVRYRTPGAYVEFPAPLAAPRTLRTDIAGFVGIAERGPAGRPVRVDGWTEFTSIFGGHVPYGVLAPAVQGFFANGGATAWIVRAASPTARVGEADGGPVRVRARGPGSWSAAIGVRVHGGAGAPVTVEVDTGGPIVERWEISEDAIAAAGADLTPTSRLIEVVPADPPTPTPAARLPLAGGHDGLAALLVDDFTGARGGGGLEQLEGVDEVAILAIPDLVFRPTSAWPVVVGPGSPDCATDPPAAPGPPVHPQPEDRAPLDDDAIRAGQRALVAQCELLRDRVAVLDVPAGRVAPAAAIEWRAALLPSTSFAALYAPWLRVPVPATVGGPLRDVPPCGHVAGLYARGDRRTGPEKPPGNEELEAAHDLTWTVDDDAHADMNDAGVNAIRAYPGRGIRPMGARTMYHAPGDGQPGWRYVNVRRLACFVRESIEEAATELVFEPSGPDLWRRADRVARGVLDRIWRRGGLAGATADDAYSVRCDEATNPPDVAEAGQLVCDVGFRPPFPAELVVVRVTIRQASAELVELGAGRG